MQISKKLHYFTNIWHLSLFHRINVCACESFAGRIFNIPKELTLKKKIHEPLGVVKLLMHLIILMDGAFYSNKLSQNVFPRCFMKLKSALSAEF